MYKVYGPYTRKDGRKHVIHYDGKKRRTQSYPRYLMEQHLGRELLQDEHVDHINEDFTDDRIENLQLLCQVDNTLKSIKPAETISLPCVGCGKHFKLPLSKFRANQLVAEKDGPFCSKRCVGLKYH